MLNKANILFQVFPGGVFVFCVLVCFSFCLLCSSEFFFASTVSHKCVCDDDNDDDITQDPLPNTK